MRSRSLCRGSDEAGAFVAAQGLTAGPAFRKAELLTAFYIYDFVVKSCPFESRDFEQNHREAEKSVKIRKKRGCKRLFLTAILYRRMLTLSATKGPITSGILRIATNLIPGGCHGSI